MGKSFVMKRPDGSLAGYLVQGNGTICFRAHALPAEGGELTLMLSGGARESRPVSGEREAAWSDRGRTVEAAYVSKDEKLLMSTGEQGRRAFEAALEHAQAKRRTAMQRGQRSQPFASSEDGKGERLPDQRAERPCTGPGGAPVLMPDAGPSGEEEEPVREIKEEEETAQAEPPRHPLPERRWPPPPCMPKARYEEGSWQT